MFKALKSLFGISKPPSTAEPQSFEVSEPKSIAVPPQARELAHRLLGVVLEKFDVGERVVDIEELDVSPHRVLVQLLPIRVYVYALGSRVADQDFDAMLSSQRPMGAVFDAFEMEIGGTRCGFYVYCLSALSDREALSELWSYLRAEIGTIVRTAALPPAHTQHHGYDQVTIDGDPDELSQRLIEPSLPAKYLDQISIADERGYADFLAQLFLRMGKASIEKDELVRFVARNRPHFNEKFLHLLETANKAALRTDKSTGAYFEYVCTNIRLALKGEVEKMDMRSDRLFWLVYALGQLLESNKIDIATARTSLARPETIQRISQHQLLYMIQDIAEALYSPQEPPVTMMLLIGECALLGRHADPLEVACKILVVSSLRSHAGAATDLIARSIAWLHCEGKETRELSKDLERLKARAHPIPDEDF